MSIVVSISRAPRATGCQVVAGMVGGVEALNPRLLRAFRFAFLSDVVHTSQTIGSTLSRFPRRSARQKNCTCIILLTFLWTGG